MLKTTKDVRHVEYILKSPVTDNRAQMQHKITRLSYFHRTRL